MERDEAYSHIALSAELERSGLDPRDRGLATAIVYGVLTWQRSIDNILTRNLRKGGVARLDPQVRTILRMGALQLRFFDRIPDHAAVDAAVELTKTVGKARAAGLVNAVLRSVASDEEPWWREADLDRKRARYLADRWSLPVWLANRLWQQFNDEAEALAEAFTKSPPVYLRKTSAAEDLENVQPVEGVPGAFVGGDAQDWREGVVEGNWVVQDLGSQLIGHFVEAKAGERVLDACAGLGGKTLHLAETGATVVALDPVESKIEMLRDGATKLGLKVEAHATTLEQFEDTDGFDRVLVDAPCSGLGILRRHAETRWRRSETDIGKLARLQQQLLDQAAGHVRAGGLLVYSVCTFTREETLRQTERFLERHPEFVREPVSSDNLDWAPYLTDDGDLRTMPHLHDADGFYAVRLRRTET